MSTRYFSIASSLTLAAVSAVAATTQQPHITNGRVTTQDAGVPFVQSFRTLMSAQTDVTWIAYSVPVVDGERSMCCDGSDSVYFNSSGRDCCSSCSLEPSGGQQVAKTPAPPGAAATIQLEGADRMTVLIRVVDRQVDRIRIFSHDCSLDAGGRTVVWLNDVGPADSIALLESFAQAEARSRVVDGAIAAIALHRDAAADAALDRLLAASQPVSTRKKVTFWLGNARGARGLDTLRRVLREDPAADVRKSAVFGVSQSPEPGAFDLLANLARSDTSTAIRSEAVFWIAQKEDKRAPGVVLEVLENDAAREVRKKAVFALSQLKENGGVDALIQTARTSTDPSIRGEAIFWLGQKAGKKASDTITERIEQDPDTEVKKRAVFALSQLPKDEGVPLLIQVARTNGNREVRKQAMFWLAQSKDPRAVDFFAEILK
jgi:HEAT repeat protein